MTAMAMLQFILVGLCSGLIFEDDFSVDPRSSGKWVFDAAAAAYDSASQQPSPAGLVSTAPGALLMTGTTNGAIFKNRSFSTGETGGAYSVALSWSAGFLVPMDEDVQVYLCNMDPSIFEAGTKSFPTTGTNPGQENLNLWPHTNRHFLGEHCVGGEVGYTTNIAGPDAYAIAANLGYDNNVTADGALGRADTGFSCDARDVATAAGTATVVQTLTVSDDGSVSFTTNLPGCGPLTRTIGNSFDPAQPAWIIVETDDDNLHFVELQGVEVTDAAGAAVWSTQFGDAAQFEREWYAPGWQHEGCIGDPDSQPVTLVLGGHMEMLGTLALQARVAGGSGAIQLAQTPSFSVEATVMSDWLQPFATDHNVAILLCEQPLANLSSWSVGDAAGCVTLMMRDSAASPGGTRRAANPPSYAKSAYTPGGASELSGGECSRSPFVTLQVVYEADVIRFHDVHSSGSSCADVSIANPFSLASEMYVYLATDDKGYTWTTISSFAIRATASSLTPASLPGAVPLAAAAECTVASRIWVYYGTPDCSPAFDMAAGVGHFSGEIGPLVPDGCNAGSLGRMLIGLDPEGLCCNKANTALFADANADGTLDFGTCYMFNAAALAQCAASHTARHSTHSCHSRRSVPPHTHY